MAQNAAHTDLFEVPIREEYYTYRCHYCGFECVQRSGLPSGLPITQIGDYGANATPTPTAYIDLMYTANTISFTAGSGTTPDTISDSAKHFADYHIGGDMTIVTVSTSGLNDNTYTIASKGAKMASLTLQSTGSLTTESAAHAGTVSIYRVLYFVDQHSGCPFCASKASKGIGNR